MVRGRRAGVAFQKSAWQEAFSKELKTAPLSEVRFRERSGPGP
jgi:hypothetical protein